MNTLPKMKRRKAKPLLNAARKSVPEVCILESLSFADEKAQHFEGRILSDILRMCGKRPRYYYFRTEAELKKLVTMFRRSNYRYLHLACHGNEAAIYTTLGERISFVSFAKILSGHLAGTNCASNHNNKGITVR